MTVVGDYINTMMTTFDFDFDLYQAIKLHEYTNIWKQSEAVNSKSFSLILINLLKIIFYYIHYIDIIAYNVTINVYIYIHLYSANLT